MFKVIFLFVFSLFIGLATSKLGYAQVKKNWIYAHEIIENDIVISKVVNRDDSGQTVELHHVGERYQFIIKDQKNNLTAKLPTFSHEKYLEIRDKGKKDLDLTYAEFFHLLKESNKDEYLGKRGYVSKFFDNSKSNDEMTLGHYCTYNKILWPVCFSMLGVLNVPPLAGDLVSTPVIGVSRMLTSIKQNSKDARIEEVLQKTLENPMPLELNKKSYNKYMRAAEKIN